MPLKYSSWDWGYEIGPIQLPNHYSVMFDIRGEGADPLNWEHTMYGCHVVCRDGELEITEQP